MSCITSTMIPQPPALKMTCAIVCGNSLGTVELLYVKDGVLLTNEGDVLTVRKR